MEKICTKHILNSWKMVENMFFLDNKLVGTENAPPKIY